VNVWQRRVAFISSLHFMGLRECAVTLASAWIVLSDTVGLIHKASGWMLREVANRDRATAERFLLTHYRQMPRTMLRYALERFPERRRKQYLSGTIAR
jgi:3-methyladenine DNA glycosylase AlkD